VVRSVVAVRSERTLIRLPERQDPLYNRNSGKLMESIAVEAKNFVGWRQFLSGRKRILDAYDAAKAMQHGKPVKTEHGNVAEARFREWLSSFLPQRYGVTSGYVIPEVEEDNHRMTHFDVIVYDALNSPILWLEENSDRSSQGSRRGVPAEYVLAVMECKSRLTKSTLIDALAKLKELDPLLTASPTAGHMSSGTLPKSFTSHIILRVLRLHRLPMFGPGAVTRGPRRWACGASVAGAGITPGTASCAASSAIAAGPAG
jgi:hypothetical protein